MQEIKFKGLNHSYSIFIGNNIINLLPKKIKNICPNTKKVALIIDSKVPSKFKRLIDQNGYPGSKPPWGTLTSINLKSGKIKISSFGTFKVINKKERIGRNPKTKIEAIIVPRKVVKFIPSTLIKEKLNS